MNDNKHILQPLDEYIRQSEPEQRERGEAWRVAIGLQQVDGLTTSDYLLDTARQHIDGSMLLGEEHTFQNRELHIDWKESDSQDAVQSANSALSLPTKCKNCTLEEVTVLHVVQLKPTATQKEIASDIGKSERTVKTLTVTLQEKGILRRIGGKRDGKWEIIID